jgi:hypothetical protein
VAKKATPAAAPKKELAAKRNATPLAAHKPAHQRSRLALR